MGTSISIQQSTVDIVASVKNLVTFFLKSCVCFMTSLPEECSKWNWIKMEDKWKQLTRDKKMFVAFERDEDHSSPYTQGAAERTIAN